MIKKRNFDILRVAAAAPLVALSLAACGKSEVNAAPEIVGAFDIDCITNERVDLLYRVAALDEEDGDITPKMIIDVSPQVTVTDGYATFPRAGMYEVNYYVEDSDGEAAEAFVYVTVYDRDAYRVFLDANGFYATASGDAEIVRESITGGRYTVETTGGMKQSDVVLSREFELIPQEEYRIEYTVRSSAMGTLRIFADDGELARKEIDENVDCTFSVDYTAPALSSGENGEENEHDEPNEGDGETADAPEEDDEEIELREVRFDLQIGSFGDAVFEIVKVKITPKNATGEYVEQLDGFDYEGRASGRFDGTAGSVEFTDGGARLNVTQASNDKWRGGMFINTGVPLDAGDVLEVSFNAVSDTDAPFEVVVQNRQWDEHKFATVAYPKESERATVEFEVNDSTRGELWLYVQSGDRVNGITFGELSVRKRSSGETVYSFDDFTASHGEGGDGKIEVRDGKVIYTARAFGATDWNNKIESPIFRVDGAADKYVISFKAKASRRIKATFAAPRAGGWDPNLLWTQFTVDTEERYYFFTTDAVTAAGDHQLLWQLGAVENQRYSDVTVEISDIRISLRHGLLDYNDK